MNYADLGHGPNSDTPQSRRNWGVSLMRKEAPLQIAPSEDDDPDRVQYIDRVLARLRTRKGEA